MSARENCSFVRTLTKAFFLPILAIIAALPALVSDTQPPVLTGFTFSQMSVNTTTAPATVNLTAQITDNLSGVRDAYMYFVSPSGNQSQYGGFSLTSGACPHKYRGSRRSGPPIM